MRTIYSNKNDEISKFEVNRDRPYNKEYSSKYLLNRIVSNIPKTHSNFSRDLFKKQRLKRKTKEGKTINDKKNI